MTSPLVDYREHPIDIGWVLTACVAVCICIATHPPAEVYNESYKVIHEKERRCKKGRKVFRQNV